MKTITQTFDELREKRRIALMPFIPAGYPDLATTAACLPALARAGASIIEVGIPFSDPIADGPVIQAAFTEALAKKVGVADVFATVASVREQVSAPIVAMVSYSVVFRFGLARFCTNAKLAGFNGLIIPDLPPPEAQRVCGSIRSAGLDTILLVAPTTSPQRRVEIASLCSGFVYYLSVTGITGERTSLPADLRENVKSLKAAGGKPVCVGFGVSTAEHVKQLSEVADGAIVGTALVRRMQRHAGDPQTVAAAAGAYTRELLASVR